MANNRISAEKLECSYKKGKLPGCAPLSMAYVPFQEEDPPVYGSGEALMRGTLYPGLDLPFKNIVNKTMPYANTPLGEVMALGFVKKELNLYLDTHPHDGDAFRMLRKTIELCDKARAKYVRQYGPLTIEDLEDSDEFTWLCDPWPWEFAERRPCK